MADTTEQTTETTETTTEAVDFGTFVPDEFKGKDGAWDTGAFRAKYDDMAATLSQHEERRAALPKDPKDYAFSVPDDHAFPEGFDPETMKTKDEQGNDVAFDVKSMIDPNDPDIPHLQAVMKEYEADPAMMGKLASILANRELRTHMDNLKKADEETRKLGPEAKARFASVERTLGSRLPREQVTAIMDGIISADGLRAIENILKSPTPTVSSPGNRVNVSDLSPVDRVLHGLNAKRA